MRVFQIGAAGGVGRRLTPLLVARGDQASGMHRGAQQADTIRAAGGTPVLLDLIAATTEELAVSMAGHDAVVFSAGAHGTGMDKTTLIDGVGLQKAADAAELAGATRFVLVSAFPEAGRGAGLGEGFEHYIRVKKASDVYLASTSLDWLIVRPGTLRDEPGSGLVSAGVAIDYGDVSRDNVAAFIDSALHLPELSRIIVELTDGVVPVEEATAAVASSVGPRKAGRAAQR